MLVFAFMRNDGLQMALNHKNVHRANEQRSEVYRACKNGEVGVMKRLFEEGRARPDDVFVYNNVTSASFLAVGFADLFPIG